MKKREKREMERLLNQIGMLRASRLLEMEGERVNEYMEDIRDSESFVRIPMPNSEEVLKKVFAHIQENVCVETVGQHWFLTEEEMEALDQSAADPFGERYEINVAYPMSRLYRNEITPAHEFMEFSIEDLDKYKYGMFVCVDYNRGQDDAIMLVLMTAEGRSMYETRIEGDM